MTDRADVDRFRQLFDANFSALLAYAVRREVLYEDAKDVVADVFTVAWRRRDDLPADLTEQRMWLYGVARRVVSNRHRSEVRRFRLNDRLAGVAPPVVLDHGANDDDSDLARAIEALDALTPDDRGILLLALWEELTPSQIATVTGWSAANVSVRLHRAKARLRKEFLRQVKEPAPGGHVIDRRAHGDIAPETTP